MPEETILELKAKAFDLIMQHDSLCKQAMPLRARIEELLQQINSVSLKESLALGGTQGETEKRSTALGVEERKTVIPGRTQKQAPTKKLRKDAAFNQEKVFNAIKQGYARFGEIAKATKFPMTKVYHVVGQLEEAGKITSNAPGKYVIVKENRTEEAADTDEAEEAERA